MKHDTNRVLLSVTVFWLGLAAISAIVTQVLALWVGINPRIALALAIGVGLGMLVIAGLCCSA